MLALKRNRRPLFLLLSMFSAFLCLGKTGWAAPSLSAGTVSGQAGTLVTLQMNFDPTSASVAGMQFNVTVPAGLSTGTVTAGSILTTANKSVNTNLIGNTWTFIIFGINQTAIPSGPLLTAQVRIGAGVSNGALSLPISNVVYTDPNGQPVTSGTTTGGSVTVVPPAPVITSAGSASVIVNTAFTYKNVATNSPTSYGVVPPSVLPPGLTINTTTGLINGTPTNPGTYSIDLSASNSGGTGTKTLTLTVNPPAPSITSAGTATGTTGVAFTYTITATNSPTSYGVVAPSVLPPGLTLNPTTGVISGSPTTAGVFSVTLQASNVSGPGTANTLTITVYSACDLNLDGTPTAPDVQLVVNQALGVSSCTADLNKDSRCDVIDVQRVVNAVLGGACVTP